MILHSWVIRSSLTQLKWCRLCSKGELHQADATGCGLNDKRVWTSSLSGTNAWAPQSHHADRMCLAETTVKSEYECDKTSRDYRYFQALLSGY